ncbi:MAG TPA: hypothetical protein VEX38_08290, partial [Fimbriimonadaceae bacterium]|nr:hypothetical protein [Fimbriimonadaceae bacterium]
DFAGGLEHRASTVLAIANMPQLHIDDLAAHEFFHTWNVKHIRPKQLGPFDYTTKVRTGNLWFAEGVTDYYAKLHTYQSGLQNQNWLLRSLGLEIAELQASKTRSVKTLEDSSKEAWENGGFGVGDLSYYTKGQLVGLIFDAEIRSKTKGAKSLDDVLRYLYREHKLPKPGYPEEGLLKALEHISGLELKDLYRKMVSSTEELPYERLSALGLRVLKPGETVPRPGYRVDIGGVMDVGQEAYAQGLREGDVIVSINGVSMSSEGLGRIAPGERYRATVQRGGEEVQLTLTMGRFQNRIWQLILDPAAGPEALARRAEWLKVLED